MSALSLRYRAHSVLDDLRFLAAIVAATFAFPGSASGQSYFDVVHTVLRTSTGEGGYSSGGGLLLATDGNLYGTTWYGGVGQFGTVFRMTPSGALTVLHSFAGGNDGGNPQTALTEGSDGNFYGTTFFGGGPANLGTVFRMTRTGAVTVLHAFVGGRNDGAFPSTALVRGKDGSFYGGTREGGGFLAGIIFRITPNGAFTILHSFDSTKDGWWPYTFVQATDGNLYGTNRSGAGP